MSHSVIVVLGMNRSGTSLLAQILERMGVWFGNPGDLVGPSRDNERGHYEYIPIVRVQQQLLKNVFGCTELFKGTLPRDWHKDEVIQLLYKEALKAHLWKALIRAKVREKPFGFKDPRTTRLLPLWREIFFELGIKPIYLLTWRNPHAVYLSIHPGTDALPNKDARDIHFQDVAIPSIPRGDIDEIWEYYQEDAWRLGSELAGVVRFDGWFGGERDEQAAMISDATGLPALTVEQLREVIEPNMRHIICQ